MTIGVIDSKICNIFSLTNMLKKLGANFKIIENGSAFKVDKVILPGVGAFPKAIENIFKYNLVDGLIDCENFDVPILGICLGMQLLFQESEEFGHTQGLSMIPGKVQMIKTDAVLPHMGWNSIKKTQDSPLLKDVPDDADFYFVHSYRVDTNPEYIIATTEYGETIPAMVQKGYIFGTQFHPEKSQKWGEIVLKNFINL